MKAITASSIVIFADGASQNRYLDIVFDKENPKIFSCADAARIMESLNADVVLIDCGIMVKKGLRLLKEIKARHPRIPVVFLNDASSEEVAIAAFRSGAREYFAKPVNRLVLRRTIRRIVEVRKKTLGERRPLSPASDEELKMHPDFDIQNLPPRLREALLYIDEYLAEKITLSSLAQGMRSSKFHFARNFQKHIGMSPMKYVNFARIQRAKVLLLREDLTITEIAQQVGYDDLSALNRNFKKIIGVTPTEFRNRPARDHCGFM